MVIFLLENIKDLTMNTTDMRNLQQFYSVVNRKNLTYEIFNLLLKRWDLDKVDLDEEARKIEEKRSTLTKSRRDAIKEFLILRNILEIKEKEEEQQINFNEN
jgi:hypothetical protein